MILVTHPFCDFTTLSRFGFRRKNKNGYDDIVLNDNFQNVTIQISFLLYMEFDLECIESRIFNAYSKYDIKLHVDNRKCVHLNIFTSFLCLAYLSMRL
jgi:hypothetical protein